MKIDIPLRPVIDKIAVAKFTITLSPVLGFSITILSFAITPYWLKCDVSNTIYPFSTLAGIVSL